MKLFRKIYLRVAVGMVLLSGVLLVWLLRETQRESLQDTAAYMEARIQIQREQFRTAISRNMAASEENRIGSKAAASYAFRTIFQMDGALYQNGTELYNASPYEYDPEKLREQNKGQMLSMEIQQVGEKKLLLFYIEEQSVNRSKYQIVVYKDVSDIFFRIDRLFWQGAGFTMAMLLLGGILLYLGIYRDLSPLLELKKTAAAIAAGAYESRVEAGGGCSKQGNEIDELAVSFNRMAEKVEEHLDMLQVTNEKQRQLLGSLAHELKTPLTAIIGYADTLLNVPITEQNRVLALNYIHSEGKRLARLSGKMLELTGLYESAEGTLVLCETSVQSLLEKLADLTSFRCEQAGLQLRISCEPKGIVHAMDEDLMMSLLMNLVDNACKASAPGNEILVSADAEGISVTDHGKGIPEDEVGRVTEAFYMVNKSRARSAGSVGLGLALCQQIAVLHDAHLVIQSREGSGSTISVRWN